MSNGLHWIDWIVIALYVAGMVALGWHYSRRQVTTDEYFTGGRAMNPWLIGISLFATLMSTISYLSGPGEIVKYGPYMMVGILSTPIAYVLIGYVIIPVYMRHRVTSAYELLETQLGLSTRLTGAVMFILLRLMWMSVLLNFAASALVVMIGIDERWLFLVTASIGTVAVVYSTLGGLRAVVITDAIQSALLFGGALMVIATVSIRLGGFSWFPTSWDSNWQSQPVFSFDPHVRLTVVGVLAMQILWNVCTYGADQTAIQRFMATRNAAAARRSFLMTSIAGIAVSILLVLTGLALLGYFREFPQLLPVGWSIATSADQLFPHYIANCLPVGISGLVVSGMFAAAMSSIDSGVNSISAVVTTDFVDRYRNRKRAVDDLADSESATATSENDERSRVRTAQLTAVTVGVFVVCTSGLIRYVPGNLVEVSKRATDLLVTPLFTLFFFGMFVRFATPLGANIGSVCGFVAAILVAFWNPLISDRSVSITWISPIALLVGLTVGTLVSLCTAGTHRRKRKG